VVHILIWDKRKSQINKYSDLCDVWGSYTHVKGSMNSECEPEAPIRTTTHKGGSLWLTSSQILAKLKGGSPWLLWFWYPLQPPWILLGGCLTQIMNMHIFLMRHSRVLMEGGQLTPPHELLGVSNSGWGIPLGNHLNPTKNVAGPTQLQKKHCSCILEGRLTTNPIILSPVHLQGLKSNIYVHFQLVNKKLIGISFRKWNHQWSTYLNWRSKKLQKN
jgi:hypothetical protein